MANARIQAHIRPYGTVTENARRILRARLAELYVWAQYAHDESRVREQHQMRIAAKRLRYTLELFRDFLPEQAGDCIKALKGVQDVLGLLHDCDVLIAILRSASFAPDEETALFAVVPEAQDLPPALLEALGQPTRLDGLSSRSSGKRKKGKQSKDAPAKKRPNAHKQARKQTKMGRRKRAIMLAEEARSPARPNDEQRAALEHFLIAKARERESLYRQFVKRWDKMEERENRAAILHLVEGAETTGRFQARPVAAHDALKPAQQL
ncbi:MAG TPA: CHAD domain-containing protein [Ktedonobacterales bacterium]